MMQLRVLKSGKAPLWLVKSSYCIGSGADSDVRLVDKRILEAHLQLFVDGDRITLAPKPGADVTVDGVRVTAARDVTHGEIMCLGRSQLQILDPKRHAQSNDSDSSLVALEPWLLQGLSSALSDWRYQLSGVHIVGRASSCDICLATAHLSRRHARLTLVGQQLIVEDLGSVNGTYVNDTRVDKAELHGGDELRFDTLRFRVLAPGAEEDADKTTLRSVVTGHLTTTCDTKSATAVDAGSRRPERRARPVSRAIKQSAVQSREGLSAAGWVCCTVLLFAFVVALLVSSRWLSALTSTQH